MSELLDRSSYCYEDEKYFYLYKHVDATDGSLSIIRNGTLKFTKPQNFNDPFDCLFHIAPDYIGNSEALRSQDEINGVKRSAARRVQESQRVTNIFKMDKNKLTNLQREIRNERAYICCLNQNPLNILMWSHYAQQHKGFLIEFRFKKFPEFPTLKNDLIFIPMPITYSKEFPSLKKKDRKTNAIADKGFLTKSLEWSYEKEWRIIRYGLEGVPEIQQYPRAVVLSSIIAGIQVDPKVKNKWEEALKMVSIELGREIQLFDAEIIENRYQLTVPNHPRLDVRANSKK